MTNHPESNKLGLAAQYQAKQRAGSGDTKPNDGARDAPPGAKHCANSVRSEPQAHEDRP
jgi:hypothetical protein